MTAPSGVVPEFTETIHGHCIADPYRWLEDRKSNETELWLTEQHVRFEDYFTRIGPLDRIRSRVREFIDVETVDQVGRVQGLYFYRKRGIGEQQPSLFVTGLTSPSERLLVNPADLGTYASVGIHRISQDGGLLAYELKQGGEHSKAIFIIQVQSGVTLPDHLDRGLARGFAFRNTNDGFYYCHDPLDLPGCTLEDHIVRFHQLGSPAEDDIALLRLPRTKSSKLVLKSDGERLAAIFCHDKNGAKVVTLYASLQSDHASWMCICQDVPMPFGPFFYNGRLFAHWFQDKPNGAIIELELASGVPLRVIVPEWNSPIEESVLALDRFYVSYLVGTESVVRIHSLEGEFLGTQPLESGHTWRLLPGHVCEVDEVFLESQSFTKPPTIFRCQNERRVLSLWQLRHTPAINTAIVSRKLSYQSKDGTVVEMSLVGPQNNSQLVDRPMIMTAYGGFGLTLTPQYSILVSALLELGFLFAMPEIRGGRERGAQWHEAARRHNRQVAFDDFIAAAEWLCAKGFTNPQRLAIFGGSNSGILVGTAITQRPDLFRAALCVAPLFDMVRYHLFDRARTWLSEYGTADDPDDLRALLRYSPYHRVDADRDYPATLIICGDKDTRCNPAHARKMIARLLHRPAQQHAILLDSSAERGHAPIMPLSVRIESLTQRIAFLCHELGVLPDREEQYETTCL